MTATLHLHHVDALPADLSTEARRIMAAYLDHHTATTTGRHRADAPSSRTMRARYAPDLTRADWARGVRALIAADLFTAHRDQTGAWHVDVATDQPAPTPAPCRPRSRTRAGVPGWGPAR